MVAHIGNQDLFCSACKRELRNQIAYGAGSGYNYILPAKVSCPASGMGAYCRRLYHGPIIKRHFCRQLYYALFIYNEIVLSCSICLESLHAKMFTDIILASFARVTFPAYKLRPGSDCISRSTNRDFRSDSFHNSRIFVSLHYGIEGCGVFPVIRVYFTAANTDTLYMKQYLMWFKVFRLGSRYVLKNNVFRFN